MDLSLPFADCFCQQNGFMHGGAIASVADSANGYAAFTLAPPDSDVLAVEFKINLLAPARAPAFLACGRVLRSGRRLTVCQAEVFTAGPDERTLIAVMLSTIIVRPMRPGAGAAWGAERRLPGPRRNSCVASRPRLLGTREGRCPTSSAARRAPPGARTTGSTRRRSSAIS